MKAGLILMFSLLVSSSIFSQSQKIRLDIFIDCQMYCDFTYIKEEIQFVNYMQNRQEADIFILATYQGTGAGGSEVQLVLIGDNEYSSIKDTIKYFTNPDDTDAIKRESFVKELKRGLLQFLVKSPIASQINYTIDLMEGDSSQSNIVDPWNNWVFNIGGNGWLNGEDSYSSIDLIGRFSASMITNMHKLSFSTFYNYEKSTFRLTGGEESFVKKSYNVNLIYVKSIGHNLSVGFTSRTGSSTFGNTDISASLKPAIEYNVFPYSESSTQRFSFNYSIGPEYYNYTDSTIYDQLTETRMRHGLEIDFNQTQKWGNVSFDIGIQQYLHELGLYNVYFNPNIEWQIFKGLSVNFGGYASFVSDRINIAKSDITDEDILLQIKQLDTDFTYFTYFGLNYRFGSMYNNYVNPRF